MKLTDKESETLADLLSRFLGHPVEHSFNCYGDDEWEEEFSIKGTKIDNGYEVTQDREYHMVLKDTGDTYILFMPDD